MFIIPIVSRNDPMTRVSSDQPDFIVFTHKKFVFYNKLYMNIIEWIQRNINYSHYTLNMPHTVLNREGQIINIVILTYLVLEIIAEEDCPGDGWNGRPIQAMVWYNYLFIYFEI